MITLLKIRKFRVHVCGGDAVLINGDNKWTLISGNIIKYEKDEFIFIAYACYRGLENLEIQRHLEV